MDSYVFEPENLLENILSIPLNGFKRWKGGKGGLTQVESFNSIEWIHVRVEGERLKVTYIVFQFH